MEEVLVQLFLESFLGRTLHDHRAHAPPSIEHCVNGLLLIHLVHHLAHAHQLLVLVVLWMVHVQVLATIA
jgi:hypothetical protein